MNILPIPTTKIIPPTPIKPYDEPPITVQESVLANDRNSVDDLFHTLLPEDNVTYLFSANDPEIAGPHNDEAQRSSTDPSIGTNGRLSDAIKQIRDEGYREIDRMFATLAQKAAIDVDRLVSGYYRSFASKVVGFNSWNTYQIYFTWNRDEEVKETYGEAEYKGTYMTPYHNTSHSAIFQVPQTS
jgi:hypothetical protein